MAVYVVVLNGEVINIVEWEGNNEWRPEEGEAILSPGNVGIGWSYNGEDFVAPAIPARTQEELSAEVTATKQALRAHADSAIVPLQYAVDLDDASSEETALLKKWKQYVVALNRLDLSTAPDITWPKIPSN